MQIPQKSSHKLLGDTFEYFFFFQKPKIKGVTFNVTQAAMHIHIPWGIYRLKESSHRRDTQTFQNKKKTKRRKTLLPGVVLLPEADCWTKATRHKPTNPKLARIKACAYMFTLSVVEREYFSPLWSVMLRSIRKSVCKVSERARAACVSEWVCACMCARCIKVLFPEEREREPPVVGHCAIPFVSPPHASLLE